MGPRRSRVRITVRAGVLVAAITLAAAGLLPAVGSAVPTAPGSDPGGGPAPETIGPAWEQVSAGGFHTCALRQSGRVLCWGHNGAGQLGDGTEIPRPRPVRVAGGHTDWTAVDVGMVHSCGIRAPGRLYCWGSDFYGTLGDDAQTLDQASPVEVDGGHTDWVAVSAGHGFTCAIRADGSLYCWGRDFDAQLGNPDHLGSTLPVHVGADLGPWAAVEASTDHTCGRTTAGRLYCWGRDTYGQTGDGPGPATHETPVEVAGGRSDWDSIALGRRHTCATTTTGQAYCWGDDDLGQRGDGGGGGADVDVPVAVLGGATDWIAVGAERLDTCGIGSDASLWCWGWDDRGRLGDGPPAADRSRPSPVAGGRRWADVSVGRSHACAITVFDRLFCWGADTHDQLGDGGDNLPHYTPNPVG